MIHDINQIIFIYVFFVRIVLTMNTSSELQIMYCSLVDLYSIRTIILVCVLDIRTYMSRTHHNFQLVASRTMFNSVMSIARITYYTIHITHTMHFSNSIFIGTLSLHACWTTRTYVLSVLLHLSRLSHFLSLFPSTPPPIQHPHLSLSLSL